MSVQDFLTFSVYIEKAGVILIGLPLYVTWPFSVAALSTLSLFYMFSSGKETFWSSLFGVL